MTERRWSWNYGGRGINPKVQMEEARRYIGRLVTEFASEIEKEMQKVLPEKGLSYQKPEWHDWMWDEKFPEEVKEYEESRDPKELVHIVNVLMMIWDNHRQADTVLGVREKKE